MPRVRALTEAERRKQADKKRDDALLDSIVRERASKKMAMDELGAKIGLSRASLFRRFKDPSSLTLKEYRGICAALGLEVKV